jgi:hypothetical protein
MLEPSTISHTTGAAYIFAAILPLWLFGSYLISPLRQFPGPFLAGMLLVPRYLPQKYILKSLYLTNLSLKDGLICGECSMSGEEIIIW